MAWTFETSKRNPNNTVPPTGNQTFKYIISLEGRSHLNHHDLLPGPIGPWQNHKTECIQSNLKIPITGLERWLNGLEH